MKILIQHNEEDIEYLRKSTFYIEGFSSRHAVLDVEEKYFKQFAEITDYVEMNFEIKLNEETQWISRALLEKEDFILAFIGVKECNELINAYYNIKQHKLENIHENHKIDTIRCINCYSETNEINAIDYIKCICFLANMSAKYHKPIIIYTNLYVPNKTYRYRTLAYKISNIYLGHMNGVLITKCKQNEIHKYYSSERKAYESYLNHGIYLEVSLEDAVKKALPFLYLSKEASRFKKMYKHMRKKGTLYEDVFYEQIPPQEKIYVFLNLGNNKKFEYYKQLGMEVIPLIDHYSLLYGKKELFDKNWEAMKTDVFPQYHMPILSCDGFYGKHLEHTLPYELQPKGLQYKGEDVYIATIGVEGVDYTHKSLCTKEGKTRIACIWEQKQGEEGQYYFKQDINKALVSESPRDIIPFNTTIAESTMLLGIAGGESEEDAYKGVATEAEFLVAKVNIAPEELQKIYGGIPSEKSAIMPDILIGMIKLFEFAKKQGKPLVFCLPFNNNIDPHDGSFILGKMIEIMAARSLLAIVVPVGEEANKKHHHSITGKLKETQRIKLIITKENQNVIGVIYQKLVTITDICLYPPLQKEKKGINLKHPGSTLIDEKTTVYSNGEKINFSNGVQEINFRIDNPPIGEWEIEIKTKEDRESKIEIYLSQQALNGYATLMPSNPFMTVGSIGNINHIMSVGGYDKENKSVLKTSGRGYNWDDETRPLFVTHSSHIIAPCKEGKWMDVTGTLPAAAIMAGAVAVLYSKLAMKQISPFPNTLVTNHIILETVKALEGIEYPNPSYGYGIFELESLR